MLARPHVALLIETSTRYGRGLITGIGQYIKDHGPWSVYIQERGFEQPLPRWLRQWHGDGIIARISSESIARTLAATRIPVVNVNRFQTKLPLASIWQDESYICKLALGHLAEHGFRTFGYCGWLHVPWSHDRGLIFAQTVRRAGYGECFLHMPEHAASTWEQEQDDLAAWLKSLPTPIGLLAANDSYAVQVLDACQRIGLPVPEQCAVLGVDNEVMLCELTSPPLSSIDQDEERTGYQAARLLDRLMNGKEDIMHLEIPALGVIARGSTDSIAVDDAQIATALGFLRRHACDHISISDVATQAGIPMRELQRRFKAVVGCTPLDLKLNLQLRRIREMLSETDLKLEAIAKASGFRYVGHMSSFFKERTGTAPGQFRARAKKARLGRKSQEIERRENL